MHGISNEARTKREIVNINLRKIFASEPDKLEKIWNLVLENEKENRFDSPFTIKILRSVNNLTHLKNYLNDVLDNPESIHSLPKPRLIPNSHPVDSLAENFKNLNVKQPSDALKALHEPPTTLQYFERFRSAFSIRKYEEWFTVSKMKSRVDDEDKYCDPDLAKRIVDEKEGMAQYSEKQKHIMRQTANAYEKVKAACFQNREAMKLAALDRMFDFVLTDESDPRVRLTKNPMDIRRSKSNENGRDKETFFFADVGGGPGSHAEFVLWRKGYYNAKGFGFTMKSRNPNEPDNMGDYVRKEFAASSFAFFDTYYGVKNDGDLCDPKNLKSLEDYVKAKTDGKGVHLVTGDAAVNPDGRETRQELFHNRLFLSEFIAAVSLCRIDEGNFVCKLYDTVTPFTVGLIYLMWVAFDEIAICKPVTVRPACSEKFLICKKLTKMGATVIKDYLSFVNEQFDKLPDGMDITQIVPKARLDKETRFIQFMMGHNRKVFLAQIHSLQFYKKCLENSSLAPKNQNELRVKALKYWDIPDISRGAVKKYDHITDIFEKLSRKFDLRRYDHFVACHFTSVFRTIPNLSGSHSILNDFAVQMLDSEDNRILISDDFGFVYLIQPGVPIIKGSITNSEYHGFPPRSIVLIQHKKENFGSEAQNFPIRIIDAAVLAGDEVAFLPLLSRLKYAKKFAQNAVFRFHNKKIPLEVIPAAPLTVAQIKKYSAVYYGTLKISRLYKQQYNTVWNKEQRCKEIIDTSTFNIVPEQRKFLTYSTFWDNLLCSCKVPEWGNSRNDFIEKIAEIRRKFCTSNGLSADYAYDDEMFSI